jgi:glycerophosphoryl diester phosphodiesterase
MSRTLVIAHRGVAQGADENTLQSFANAIDIHADMVEFDIRLTRNGEMIAFHNSHINNIPVSSLTRSQITSAAGAQPALFADILDLCSGKIGLDIELKENGYVDQVAMAVKESISSSDQIIVTSFIPAALGHIGSLLPDIRTGLLVGIESPKPYLRTRLRELYPIDTAKSVGAYYIAPHWLLARLGVLKRAAAAGMPCLVWTVNSDKDMHRFASDPRVEAIITDKAADALRIVGP